MQLFTRLMILCLALGAVSGCKENNTSSILGPQDKPNFKSDKWEKVEIGYWVPRKEGPNHLRWHRKLTISDTPTLSRLEDSFSVSKIGPNNLGANRKLVITMTDGLEWQGACWETKLHLCKSEDNYYSYRITLSDSSFFDLLRELCLENEKKVNPSATIDDICF